MTLAAVIPTKNRPHDLRKAVVSLLAQDRPADELVIVDQSGTDDSSMLVHDMLRGHPRTRLVYIHDTRITGLVEAKRVGAARASSDIVCFLEDDVILEPAYMAQIEWGFQTQPDMYGCSGIITNLPYTSPIYIAAHAAFFTGIFRDPRLVLTTRALGGSSALMPCDILSGGISSWRRQVFDTVQFDTDNGFHFFEDMEFSTRVVRALGHHLYINPRARLEHHGSPVNRDVHGARQRRKLGEAVVFYKKRKAWPGALRGLVLVMIWWFVEATVQSVRLFSFGPLAGYIRGVADGLRKPLVAARSAVA